MAACSTPKAWRPILIATLQQEIDMHPEPTFSHAGSQKTHFATASCDLKRRSQENRQRRLKQKAAEKQRAAKRGRP
jgi:hypothetical protein